MNEFRIKKENLKKLAPILLDKNINFSVRCTGKKLFHDESWDESESLNNFINTKLGDKFVAISIAMSGTQFHKMLIETCGKENIEKWS